MEECGGVVWDWEVEEVRLKWRGCLWGFVGEEEVLSER